MATDSHVEKDFSDYYDQALDAARKAEIKSHLDDCEQCRSEYTKFREALSAITGLNKMSAPAGFDGHVANTIRRRSGGRFFGQKAFGQRVPYEVIAVLIIILTATMVLFYRWSGSVHGPLQPTTAPTQLTDEQKNAIPLP